MAHYAIPCIARGILDLLPGRDAAVLESISAAVEARLNLRAAGARRGIARVISWDTAQSQPRRR